ncbi:penicillin-binding protein activator LpoB [Sodalis endosymbiont of Henestaris halophilus]|uniref:penicillin-binding protein activator LpoB n=1 Tax=Sodalis endosymbiont of Henestaris halophilus TaxID=1929246 RepID=UPI000BBFE92E|nr:penicillin-binding protein activator LpoB [Sodalis endosymbiont of Henestaris halophilus]SNC58668.1 Penicillin-binding protein activator LpoB precursor [Sodalis endosymbiont of Henestaris halophilus]
MEKIALIVFATMVLSSCTTRSPELLPITIKPTLPLVNNELVPIPPKIKTIDWRASFSPMVQEMLAVQAMSDGSVLLVNKLKNATNGNLQTSKATEMLTFLIANGSEKFQIVDDDKLNAARQNLGLFADDSLESLSKAVGLARHLNAQYVLYSTAIGDVTKPMLKLQLILAKTGEIIWYGNGVAQE